jgi:NAD-dependent deacetylase sirtuin 2
MPKEFFNFEEDFKQCDLLIIMGTSLKVQPFGSIYNHVPEDCPRLLINREVVGEWLEYEENPKLNYRDVALLGDCDNICLKLAEKLGFKKELLKMVDQKQ